jgi:phosphoglycolate phosphatase-like HAD superfamily hydrolase
MMTDRQAPLKNLEKRKDFLVVIDSDGCAFDSMEITHKECFIPAIIKYWDLQPVSRYARAAAEFVNLYSRWRGSNRFEALIMIFDLLEEWPVVAERGAVIPRAKGLRRWIERGTVLDNPALAAEVERTGDTDLARALAWSAGVNVAIADMVHGVPPFPHVPEVLGMLADRADIIVCSGAQCETVERVWAEHRLVPLVRVIAGREMGSKAEHLSLAVSDRYDRDKVLMIGDSPFDGRIATASGVRFYPINPGRETASWERFALETAGLFFAGDYDVTIQDKLVQEFEGLLPETPPWQR